MWQPRLSVDRLYQKAAIIAQIRRFFSERAVLEVDVPLLGLHSVSDPYMDALSLEVNAETAYLQTSPEYFMKRMLAAGSGDIYYLGKAFRADERGRLHRPEFTMLEWYRLGLNDWQLADEVFALIRYLKPEIAQTKMAYAEVFFDVLGLNPHTATDEELGYVARERIGVTWINEPRNTWLDLLFSHLVEPALPDGVVLVYDYPASQCALARCAEYYDEGLAKPINVAKRFEIFFNQIELANGYWELSDAFEQRQRFEEDNRIRRHLNKPEIVLDEHLLAAVEYGLPDCAGVAMGLDRLIMGLLGLASIDEQATF